MNINDLFESGSDILDAVNDAVNRNDFSELNSTIKKTVQDVSETIQRDVRDYSRTGAREDIRRRTYRSTYGQGGTAYQGNPYRRYKTTANTGYGQQMNRQQPAGRRFTSKKTPFLQKIISRQTGLGKILAGAFGVFVGVNVLMGNIIALIAGATGGAAFGLLASALILGASAYAIMTGRKDKELVSRYYEYAKIIGDAEYIEIEKLARKAGRTKADVLADIKALRDKGVLTEAWLDEQETTLILTEEVYNQYQEIKAQSEILRQQAEKENSADADLPENARAIIREGKEYIKTIHEYNDEIPGVEMSEKLYRLESTMDRIVEQVRQNPSSAPELRKLMSYYLPTTVKLLKAYKELDKQTVSGENITNTKQEIENALDTINDAFEKLLDSLFQNMAWDVSSDISVMNTMFAQDGLTPGEMSAQSGQTVAETENQVYGTTLTWGDGGSAVQAQSMEEEK
jgi:5-bromo-4-chloroindolyl phosphate hydrolysis protein